MKIRPPARTVLTFFLGVGSSLLIAATLGSEAASDKGPTALLATTPNRVAQVAAPLTQIQPTPIGVRAHPVTESAPAPAEVKRGEHAHHAHGAAPTAAFAESSDEELIALFALADSPAVRAALLARLKRDPSKVDWALAQFAAETDPARLGAWARLLGNVADRRVREAVSAMALDVGRATPSRIAALKTLEAQRTLAAIPTVRTLLQNEPDAAVLNAAMYALPNPRGASLEQTAGVVEALSRHVADPRVDVRRLATTKLSDWPHDPSVAPTLLNSLESDPAPSVRAAAAFSLIWVTPKSPALLNSLAARVQDANEDWFVRENAWRALGRQGVLPTDQASVYQAFRRERAARRTRTK